MSRIDDLIYELCPDGVEHLPLKDVVSDFIVPMRDRPKTFDGDIPWCRIEDVESMVIEGSKSRLAVSQAVIESMNLKVMPVGTVIASCSASLGTYAIVGQPLVTNQTFIGLVCGERLFNRFLLYVMHTKTDALRMVSTTGTIAYISRKKFEQLVIPVPPLEVQREIVRVLDKFTQLEAELEAELEARRTQYEHYRTEFLTFGDDVPRRPLREVATIGTGSHDTKDATPDGEFIFYARGREPLRLDSYDFDEQAIITAGDGVGVGKVFHFADGKYALHQRAYRVVPGKQIDSRFIYHYLVSDFSRYLERTSVHASVTSLRRPMFLKYPVPVPPRAEQERIVATLDKLDALVNDISIGLPGELVARRKQYEHYRDRLLTFKELPA